MTPTTEATVLGAHLVGSINLPTASEVFSAVSGQFDARPPAIDAGVDALQLPQLGYAAAAIESYASFVELRESRVIAPGIRFQVSLPTPAAVIASFRRFRIPTWLFNGTLLLNSAFLNHHDFPRGIR